MSKSIEFERELKNARDQIQVLSGKIKDINDGRELIDLRERLNALEIRSKELVEEIKESTRVEKQELLEKKQASCQELMTEVANEDFDPSVKEEFLKELEQFSLSDTFTQPYDVIDTEACLVKEGLNFNTSTGKVDIMIEELDYYVGAKYHEHFKAPKAMLERFQKHLEDKAKIEPVGPAINI